MPAVGTNMPVMRASPCVERAQRCGIGAEGGEPVGLQRPHPNTSQVYAPALLVVVKVERGAEDADPPGLLAEPARDPYETITSTPHSEQTTGVPIEWEVGADDTVIKQELDIGSTVIQPRTTPRAPALEVNAPALLAVVKVERDAEDGDPPGLPARPARDPCETITSTPHGEQTTGVPIEWEVGADDTVIKQELDIGSTVIQPRTTPRAPALETVPSPHSSTSTPVHNKPILPLTTSTSIQSQQMGLSELSFVSDMSHGLSYKRTSGKHKSYIQEQRDVCFTSLPTIVHRNTHEKEKEKLFKNVHCVYSASKDKHIQSKMCTQTGNNPYKCEYCDYCTFYDSHLKSHIRTHTEGKPYKCEHCDYNTSRRDNLNSHIRIHTGHKPYKCEHCNYSASQYSNLQKHIRTHTGDKPYKCEHCEYRASVHSHLKSHMTTHTGDKPYKCEHCEYRASVHSNLKRHMTKHTGDKSYKCEHCDYRASVHSNLKRHMNKHIEDKSFKCEQCNYSACQHSDLQKHIRIHTGYKPYKCEHCNYDASQLSSLQIHIRTHTGDKPYKCEHCDYRASVHSNLKRHMTKHTGNKPYKG